MGPRTGPCTWELEPPAGGSCFRIVRIAPDDEVPLPAPGDGAADFLEAHATPTLDYVTVLSGQVTLIVGEREVTLGPGDSVVQQGVAHDWQNRGSVPCVLVGVLLECPVVSAPSRPLSSIPKCSRSAAP